VIIEMKPFAYVRRTRADCWKKRPVVLRYYASKDELILKAGGFQLGNSYKITFGVPFPDSYSKKKRESLLGMPHQQKCDLDNYLKAFQDSLLKADQTVYQIHARKIWAEEGFIEVENT